MSFASRFIVSVIVVLLPSVLPSAAHAEVDAASEVDAALAKLQQSSYRKREHIDAMKTAGLNAAPMITECVGELERLVFEIEVPTAGRIRTERIKIGSRSAVRTTAPVLVAKLEEMKRAVTVNSARNFLRQLASVASAMQTGGLSTANWIMEAVRAAATIKTTADARVALARAAEGFNSWQLVKSDEDDDVASFGPAPAQNSSEFMAVEKANGSQPGTVRYTRRPTIAMPGAEFFSVVIVDTKTGLPLAEENFINGQRMMRTEYFDVGAPISIELPECLK
jgi:hypothetical protein